MKNKKIKPKTTGYIISNPEHSRMKVNPQLLRITLTTDETKIDFGYQASDYYTNGGWIKISPKTYIKPKGTNKKLILTNAANIPYGPEKLHFNSSIEWRYFSLFFPPLQEGVDAIDLIEQEHGTDNDFNYFGIIINDEEKRTQIY
jgi:hypothetical protein